MYPDRIVIKFIISHKTNKTKEIGNKKIDLVTNRNGNYAPVIYTI